MTVAAALLGAVCWTLAEYLIHRFAGHGPRDGGRLAALFRHEHGLHHARGHYFAPLVKKILAAGVIVPVLGAPAVALVGAPAGTAWTAGFLTMYLTYEVLHRRLHTHEGVGPWARWARRHHFHHHFHDPTRNHGVTSPLWDLVFGTLAPDAEGPVRVPARRAMPWLIDPTTGDVHAHLRGRFALRR